MIFFDLRWSILIVTRYLQSHSFLFGWVKLVNSWRHQTFSHSQTGVNTKKPAGSSFFFIWGVCVRKLKTWSEEEGHQNDSSAREKEENAITYYYYIRTKLNNVSVVAVHWRNKQTGAFQFNFKAKFVLKNELGIVAIDSYYLKGVKLKRRWTLIG